MKIKNRTEKWKAILYKKSIVKLARIIQSSTLSLRCVCICVQAQREGEGKDKQKIISMKYNHEEETLFKTKVVTMVSRSAPPRLIFTFNSQCNCFGKQNL